MADTNELFDQQIHDAYERIELSGEAQDRILANLLAAQAKTGQAELPEETETEQATQEQRPRGEVVRMAPKNRPWQLLLPLAAVLVAAVVIVQMTLADIAPKQAMESMATSDRSEKTVAYGTSADSDAAGALGEAEEFAIVEEAPLASESNAAPMVSEDTGIALQMSNLYPLITLDDGTELTTLIDGKRIETVNPAEIETTLGTMVASSADGMDQVYCEVYLLSGESEAYAVRYEDEETFWRCELA